MHGIEVCMTRVAVRLLTSTNLGELLLKGSLQTVPPIWIFQTRFFLFLFSYQNITNSNLFQNQFLRERPLYSKCICLDEMFFLTLYTE